MMLSASEAERKLVGNYTLEQIDIQDHFGTYRWIVPKGHMWGTIAYHTKEVAEQKEQERTMAVAFKLVGFPVWNPDPDYSWLIQMFSYVRAYCLFCITKLLGTSDFCAYSGSFECEKAEDAIIVHHLMHACDQKMQTLATPMAKGWVCKRSVQLISDNGNDYLVLSAENPLNKLPMALQWKRVRSA